MARKNSHITGFVLKVLAIVGMTANHVAHVFGPQMPWRVTMVLYCLGGITYPSMAFLLVEGYIHTSNLRKYATRLALFAVVAQVPFTLCFGWGDDPIPKLNVLVTLLISLGILWAKDNLKNQGAFFVVFICGVAASYFCDWALSGPVLVFLFYALRGKGALGVILPMAFLYIYVIVPEAPKLLDQWQAGITSAANVISQGTQQGYELMWITGIPIHLHSKLLQCFANIGYALVGFTIATTFICLYNGKRGRSMKWFFYAYYPGHLLVIWAIHELLTKLWL